MESPEKLNILVIDDDEVDRMSLTRALRKTGLDFQTFEAITPEQVFSILGAHKIHLIFLDYLLPREDGLTILRRLRQNRHRMPVIVLTSQGDEQVAVDVMKAGGADYLTKDALLPEKLLRTIRYALRTHRAQEQHRRAMRALRRSEARLVQAQQIASIGFWEVRLRDLAIFWSDELFRIYGLEPGEIEPTFEFYQRHLVPQDKPRIRQAMDACIREGQAFRMDVRLIRKDGTVRYIEFQGKALRNRSGQITRIQGVAQDITTRKQTENALLESEELFRTLARNVPVGIFQSDMDGKCVYVNERWSEMTGIHLEEALGDGWSRALLPEEYDLLFSDWNQNVETGKDVTIEYRFRNVLTGQITWVIGTAQRLYGSDLQPRGFIGTVTDITQLKHVEEELRKMQAKSAGLLEALPDLMFHTDADGLILDFRASNPEDLVAPPEAFLNHTFLELLPPDIVQQFVEARRRLLHSRKTEVIEYELITQDHLSKYFEARISLTSEGDFLVLVRNITLRKRAEKALAEANLELAESALRARELAHAAEAASRAKSEFLANMSHELRTPLNALLGFTRFLEKTRLDEDQRNSLNAIRSASQALLSIIGDILDLSKIEAGKIELSREPFRFSELVENVTGMFSSLAQEKGLRFQVLLDPEIEPWLQGDVVRLSQVLINLLGNAFKFTEKGWVIFSAKLLPSPGPDCEIQFSIQDSGIGIPADKLESIFQSFTQASAQTSRKFGGTGLGLTISQRIVQMMGGKIEVISAPDQGSEFRFRLRMPAAGSPVQQQRHSSTELRLPEKPLRILVAEDNTLNQVMARKILQDQGWECVIAGNGIEALVALRQGGFDIILMDIQMPEMDGYEAARRIRAGEVPGTGNIPILALTAHALAEELHRTQEAGMNDILIKPYQAEDLIRQITRLVGQEQPQRVLTLNLQQLDELTDGDYGFRRELIEIFLKDGPEAVQRMREALKTRDGQSLYAAAHKVKPSVLLFGLPGGDTLIRELLSQSRAAAPDWTVLETLTERMDTLMQTAEAELR